MYYLWLSVLSVLSAVLLADLASPPAPLWGEIRVKHTWNTVPANWESLGPPPANTTIDFHIALKPRRENALIDALHEVSNPAHQKYGAHLSEARVAGLVAPHQDTLEIVRSWLEHHGVPSSSISTSHGGSWLTIAGVPVSQADELLCASYRVYRHIGTNETGAILRTVSYALPAALHAHVQTVAPTTHFPSPRTPLQTPHNRSSEEVAVLMVNATSGELARALSRRDPNIVTPPFLRWLYKTQAYVPAAPMQNVLGILGFQNGYPRQDDLTQFMNHLRVDARSASFVVVQVNGGKYDPSDTSPMASIGIQYAQAIAFPTSLTYYIAGGDWRWWYNNGGPAPGDAYLEWFRYILAQPNIPQTITISYTEPETQLPQEYATALCGLFAQLGARGVSVIVASGDDGVGAGDCKDSSGYIRFVPTFPASCPWVTSVGGTTGQDLDAEVALGLSGGGFSLYFPQPKYQEFVVSRYIFWFLGGTYSGLYRRGNRGIPDIAAQAHEFLYVRDADPHIVSSTSCSTPTVAAMVSLLNDYLVYNGRPPLGFLNPWLYGQGTRGIQDVTSGNNPGCNTAGFDAVAGWDPVTGLGAPDFQRLLQILQLGF